MTASRSISFEDHEKLEEVSEEPHEYSGGYLHLFRDQPSLSGEEILNVDSR
jgi:hypothetical protein